MFLLKSHIKQTETESKLNWDVCLVLELRNKEKSTEK